MEQIETRVPELEQRSKVRELVDATIDDLSGREVSGYQIMETHGDADDRGTRRVEVRKMDNGKGKIIAVLRSFNRARSYDKSWVDEPQYWISKVDGGTHTDDFRARLMNLRERLGLEIEG